MKKKFPDIFNILIQAMQPARQQQNTIEFNKELGIKANKWSYILATLFFLAPFSILFYAAKQIPNVSEDKSIPIGMFVAFASGVLTMLFIASFKEIQYRLIRCANRNLELVSVKVVNHLKMYINSANTSFNKVLDSTIEEMVKYTTITKWNIDVEKRPVEISLGDEEEMISFTFDPVKEDFSELVEKAKVRWEQRQ